MPRDIHNSRAQPRYPRRLYARSVNLVLRFDEDKQSQTRGFLVVAVSLPRITLMPGHNVCHPG